MDTLHCRTKLVQAHRISGNEEAAWVMTSCGVGQINLESRSGHCWLITRRNVGKPEPGTALVLWQTQGHDLALGQRFIKRLTCSLLQRVIRTGQMMSLLCGYSCESLTWNHNYLVMYQFKPVGYTNIHLIQDDTYITYVYIHVP